MALALWMAAMRKSGQYLFFRIMCRMLLSGSGVLVDGGPHVGSGRLSLAWWEKGEESPQGSVGWSGPLCPPLVRGYDLTQRTWVGAWAV